MKEYETIVLDYKNKGWQSKPFDRMLKIMQEEPETLLPFLKICLNEFPKGATFIDAAFSFISEQEIEELIELAINSSQKYGWTNVTRSVIDYASLQFPFLLKRHLPNLIRNRSESYYDKWIWRNGEQKEIDFLLNEINSGNEEQKFNAWDCLVNIRSEPALLKAFEYFDTICYRKEVGFDTYAKEAGFLFDDGHCRQLFLDNTYHIVFERSYLEKVDQLFKSSVNYSALSRNNHPTWKFNDPKASKNRFGGQSSVYCGNCGGQLHHLLNIPENMIGNKTQIDLSTCLSCLGWEENVMFFQHDNLGIPEPLKRKSKYSAPEFKSAPLIETRVQISKTPPRWEFQNWGLSNSRENLNRVGGSPTWIQNPDYPSCPLCQKTMTFCAQFDSDLLTEDNGVLLWGMGGICYSFLCSNCNVSGNLWQST